MGIWAIIIYFYSITLSQNVHRRDVLKAGMSVLGLSSLSGCIGDQSSVSNGGTESHSSPTETPVPFPEACESLPEINGLPTPPSELTEDSVMTFVEDFERVYAVTTNDEYGGVNSLDIQSVETIGERLVVRLRFEAVPVTRTPDADGMTPTPPPIDALTHRAVYRLTEERMLRELRSHIDDALFSRTCWTLAAG